MKKNNFNRRQFVAAISTGSLAAIVSNATPSFGSATNDKNNLNLTIDNNERTWIEIDNVLYGAKANNLGQIGGGSGYKNIITKGDYTVTDLDTLLDILAKAKAGQVIFIPSETVIDLTARIYIEGLVLEVPEGVTLAGDRGLNGSKGAVLTSDSLKTPLMIRAGGSNVRITGLRIQGPNPKRYMEHHKRSYGPPPYTSGLGQEYYYKFPTSNGIVTEHPHLEVDNCEISAFSNGGISLRKSSAGHHIHHNYIHKCQYNGLGYGVVLSGATSLIEYNLFNENRHSIAGTGRSGEGYIAQHNVQMGISLSHCFDMHGGRDRKDGTNIAGTSIEIYNNTFCAPTRAVVIRGVPEDKCDIHQNWFQKHNDASEAIGSEKKTNIFNNVYGPKPTKAK